MTADVAGVPPASFMRRLAAGVLDALLVLVVGGELLLAGALGQVATALGPTQDAASGHALAVGALLVLVVGLVQWTLHGRLGWTVGRRLTGLRTLDAETLRPVGMVRVLVRGLVVAAGLLACGVGQVVVLLSPLFDATGRMRGWHDKVAGDEVLDVRAHQDVVDRVARLAVAAPRPAGPAPSGRAGGRPPARRGGAAVTGGGGSVAGSSAAGASTAGASLAAGSPALAGEDEDWTPPRPEPGAAPLPRRGGPATGGLVLAPLSPRRSGPDLDTGSFPASARSLPDAAGAAGPPDLPADLELTRAAPVRPTEPPPVVVDPPGRPSADLELSDGRRVTVERGALVGRNPAGAEGLMLLRVIDPGLSVSKTHLQIGVEPGGVWVSDRGSTNGTIVTLPDGAQVVCGPEQQVRLREGAVVRFGGCWLRLVRAPWTPPPAD